MVARGEDPGPEPTWADGKTLSYCCHCDSDLTLPLAGNGRCPCFHCAKMFGKEEEWYKAHDIPYEKNEYRQKTEKLRKEAMNRATKSSQNLTSESEDDPEDAFGPPDA